MVDLNLGQPKKGSKNILIPTNGSISSWNIMGLSERDLLKNHEKNVKFGEKMFKRMRI
jgi:hypothetical protein